MHSLVDPQRFADIAYRALGSIRSHDRRHPSPIATILFIQILQHFFATLMFKIDVDIGRFIPFPADKSFEQQIGLTRINASDPQAITNGRIGGRTTTLTQNLSLPSKPDHVPHGQESKPRNEVLR